MTIRTGLVEVAGTHRCNRHSGQLGPNDPTYDGGSVGLDPIFDDMQDFIDKEKKKLKSLCNKKKSL